MSAQSNWQVRRLAGSLGAEITGLDLNEIAAGDEAGIEAVMAQLLEHQVIFFPGQKMDIDSHVALGKRFGRVESHPNLKNPFTQHDEVFELAATQGGVADEWHTDITAAINPPSASILRSVVLPPYGGDTQWLNMVKAFEALSPPMQEFLSSLRAVHQYRRATNPKDKSGYNELIDAKAMVSEHPLVTVQPETSGRALFVNAAYVDHIVGLTPRESQCLLEYLLEHCLQPEFMVRFRWNAGSVAFWDNRATQHQAIGDIFETDFDRELYRITLNGEIPVGVDGRESTAVSGEPIKPV